MTVSLEDQIACVEREIKMRRRIYPRWVEQQKLSEVKALYEIKAMECVLSTLMDISRGGRLL
jgi:hypothetical protein